MKIISSYPRSGQAKLRFLICNILYPEIDHDFETIRKYTPSIDSAEQLNYCADNVKFLFTHSNIRADIYLHRHIGDVLISEFWYKKKMYPDDMLLDLDGWILTSDFGREWRKSVECGRGATTKISFDDLNNSAKLSEALGVTTEQIELALTKCTFEKMQAIERSTDTIGGNRSIDYMREGKSRQWETFNLNMKYNLIQKNEGELEYLGYWVPDNWVPLIREIRRNPVKNAD